MVEHTPTPWASTPATEEPSLSSVLHVAGEIPPTRENVESFPNPEDGPPEAIGYIRVMEDDTHANAEFIVRAVNAHDELLAACKAALDPDPCWFDHHGNCQAHALGNPCEQKLLREAIAKAEGSTL